MTHDPKTCKQCEQEHEMMTVNGVTKPRYFHIADCACDHCVGVDPFNGPRSPESQAAINAYLRAIPAMRD